VNGRVISSRVTPQKIYRQYDKSRDPGKKHEVPLVEIESLIKYIAELQWSENAFCHLEDSDERAS
jgi:hypothetical protein